MFARTSTWSGSPEALQKWADSAVTTVKEFVEGLPGNAGLVMLGADGAVTGLNDAAGHWLEDLGGRADGSDLPIEISALAIRLRHLPPAEPAMPRLQVRTSSGRWAVLHASWLNSQAEKAMTVIVQEASPGRLARSPAGCT